MVENPTCQHILAEDGDVGREGLAGVVVEGEVVNVDCLLLEPRLISWVVTIKGEL